MTSPTHGKLNDNTIIDGVLWDGWKWTPSKGDTTTKFTYYFDQQTINKEKTQAWSDDEKAAYIASTVAWSSVADISFSEVKAQKGVQFDELILNDKQIAYISGGAAESAQHDTPDMAAKNSNLAFGDYDYQVARSAGWTAAELKPGSFSGDTFVHEMGHALGLKHPFNTIGSAEPLPGVKDGQSTVLGDHNLNHIFNSVMSYNGSYTFDSNGHIVLGNSSTIFIGKTRDLTFGYDLGPMALDIAAIQYLYGANMSYHTGNDVYVLPDANVSGTGWSCIWDAGGTDELRYNGTRNAILNLTAATLDNSDTGGGVISYAANIYGGFTIANGVVIEKATGGSGNDTITGNDVNNILTGNAGDDTISGGNGNDTLIGGLGFDKLDGGAGIDTVDYSYITDTNARFVITLDSTGTTTVFNSSQSEDTLTHIENANGSAGNDYISGDFVANVLNGGFGDDTLSGGGGGALLGNKTFDILDGGAGTNGVDYSGFSFLNNLTIVLSDTTTTPGTVRYANGLLDARLYNIQNVYAGQGNDTVTGNSAGNVLNGAGGDDRLIGGAGFDTLIGGEGSDTADYSGETGTVKLDMNTTNSGGYVQVNLQHGSDDQMYSIENVIGGLADDTLTGDYNSNTLIGGGGFDTLDGGYGDDILRPGAGGGFVDGGGGYNDTIDFSDQTLKVTLALLGSNAATFKYGSKAFGTVRNVVNIIGGSGNDKLTGDDDVYGANRLVGGAGDDTLSGLSGTDVLVGGLGNDILDGGVGQDTADYSDKNVGITVTLGAQGTATTVQIGSSEQDTLINIENITGSSAGDIMIDADTADGYGQNDRFFGGDGVDRLSGGNGDDYIQGGAGKDILDGGAGSGDYLSYEDKTAVESVTVVLNGATATRTYINGVAEDTFKNFESVIGGDGNDFLTGDSGNNNLQGGAGNDVLNGGSGGYDFFSGGTGTDTVDYSAHSDGVIVRLTNVYDFYNNTPVAGQHTTLSTLDIETFLSGSGNDIIDGDVGLRTVTGGAGKDTFVFDSTLDGTNITSITDFKIGVDAIQLDHTVFTAWPSAAGTLQAKNFDAGNFSTVQKSDDRIVYNTKTGGLYYDSDGSATTAAVEFAVLTNKAHVSNTDFTIV